MLYALVAVGGVLGSLGRYGLTDVAPGLLTTMLINATGSFLLGLLIGRRPHDERARAFLGTGVLGGFTTMSAFAVQAIGATPVHAIAYAAGTLGLGIGAAALGHRVGS